MSATAGPLQARVARLEQIVSGLQAQAGGGEALSPNYLTVDAQGRSGANFSGLIEALGVIIPESTSSSFQLPNAIEWTDAGGVAREFVEGQASGGLHRLGLQAGLSGAGNNNAFISIDDTPEVVAGANDSIGDSDSVTLINALGQSSFMRIGTLSRIFVTWGTSVVTWGGGGATTTPLVPVNFGLTFQQVQAVLLGVSATSAGAECAANYEALTTSGMQIFGWERAPIAPAAGVTAAVSWAAIGTLPPP